MVVVEFWCTLTDKVLVERQIFFIRGKMDFFKAEKSISPANVGTMSRHISLNKGNLQLHKIDKH